MKKWIIPVAIILIVAIWGYTSFKGFYNTSVEYQEDAKTKWSNVESSYQRRNDLIGNLVKTVQGAADFEKSTLESVISARAKATSVNIDASNLNAANIAQFQKAQAGMTSALSRLLVTVERYPDLKANRNFLELQAQLEGTENRINVARDRFNEQVGIYNKHIKKFPNNFFASWFDFDEMTRFESDPGSENAPEVNFDFKN